MVKLFSGKGDVVEWLKNMKLVARLQHVDGVASLAGISGERRTLSTWRWTRVNQIEAQLREAFADWLSKIPPTFRRELRCS